MMVGRTQNGWEMNKGKEKNETIVQTGVRDGDEIVFPARLNLHM
jgi:hypothetical protein